MATMSELRSIAFVFIIIAIQVYPSARCTGAESPAPTLDSPEVKISNQTKIVRIFSPVECKNAASEVTKINRQVIIYRRDDASFLIGSDDLAIDLNMLNGTIEIGFNSFNGKRSMRTYRIVSSQYDEKGVRLIDYITGLKVDRDPVTGKESATIYRDQGWNYTFKPETTAP